MKIQAATRMKITAGDGEDWFATLTKEQQKEYIEMHPNSKYAKDAGSSKSPTINKRSNITKKPAKPKNPDSVGHKLKTRFKATKGFINKLLDSLKSKKVKNVPSPGWKKKHGVNADKKVSKFGYYSDEYTWVSETQDEWGQALKKQLEQNK